MGFYSLLILSIGVLLIGGVYSQIKNKNLKNNLIFLLLLFIYVTVFFVIHHDIEKTCEILISNNLSEILNIIRSWGVAAPIISILLMILQAVIAPLPAYLITAANGIIFGLFWGVVISSIGALLGALVSFAITRWFYNNYSERLLKNSSTRQYIEKISSKHGFKVILIARLIPIISFDLISYAAGASTIKLSHFLVATFIGMLPATIIYTALANSFGGIEKLSSEFVIYSTLAAIILVIFWIIKNSLSKTTRS
ncbi:MAG: TVP38/TMEM64 family protein [Gammaproteobacteria bacterium]